MYLSVAGLSPFKTRTWLQKEIPKCDISPNDAISIVLTCELKLRDGLGFNDLINTLMQIMTLET